MAVGGAAERVRAQGAAAVSTHQPTGDGTIRTAGTIDGSARTYLPHIFGRGLDDHRHFVESFVSTAPGEIKPYAGTGGSRKDARMLMNLRAVQRIRPELDETIIATGVNVAGGSQ